MADHWGYVVAAYGLAGLALYGYWRYLGKRQRVATQTRRKRGKS